MHLVIQIGLGIALGSLIRTLADTLYFEVFNRRAKRKSLEELNRFQRLIGKPEFKDLDEYNQQWMLDAAEAAKAEEEAALANTKRTRKK